MIVASRTHDYGRQKINELAPLLKREGIGAAQIVLPKGFVEFDSYDAVTPAIIEEIKKSFDENAVRIHILGCYMDFGNPDEEVRKAAINTFKTCLRYAKTLNAGIVGTETAYPRLSKEEKNVWYPFMMDSLSQLVAAAEEIGQDMAIEPVYWHPLEDCETTVRVFETLKSDRLKMIFDPGNVLPDPDIDQAAYWKMWLAALGDKMEAIHMKDFKEGTDKTYMPVPLGEGVIDYTEIVRWTKQNKPDIVVVREELQMATAQQDIAYMKNLWN